MSQSGIKRNEKNTIKQSSNRWSKCSLLTEETTYTKKKYKQWA